jgi:hypothetical protein
VRLQVIFVALALVAAGCPANDPATGLATTPPDQLLDYTQFVCTVQPVLIRRCSYLACHGNADHALRVFSVGKLRLGDASTRALRDAPLTADEVERNFQSATGLVLPASAEARQAEDVSQVPLLLKPLASRFGGSEHHGLAIFPVYPATMPANDPEWQALVSWVGGAKQPSPPTQDCQNLLTALGLSPR